MEFEFDPAKSDANKRKHGIDFDEAQLLWDDPNLLAAPALTTVEARALFVGRIDEKYWSAVVTFRNGRIRLISVRRSRKEEIDRYESK